MNVTHGSDLNDSTVVNETQVTHSFMTDFALLYKILSALLVVLSIPASLFLLAEFNLSIMFASNIKATLIKLVIFLPETFGLAVFLLVNLYKKVKRTYLIACLSGILLASVFVLQYSYSKNTPEAFYRIYFLLTFTMFVPVLILNKIFYSRILSISLWAIVAITIFFVFSKDGGYILSYQLDVFLFEPEFSFTMFFLTFAVFLIMFIILATRLRLHPLFDFSIYSYVSIFLIFTFAVVSISLDIRKLLELEGIDSFIAIYVCFLCNYFIFVFAFIELFLLKSELRIRPIARPIYDLNPEIFPKNDPRTLMYWYKSQKTKTQDLPKENSDSNENE